MSNSNGAAPNDTGNASIPLEISIREKLQKLAPLSPSCSIYRVQERLRSLNPNVYTPKVVSIGPLHHGKDTLQDMEEHKYRYLQRFLNHTQENLEYYIQKIRNQEEKLRSYYAEIIKLSSDDFVTIILVDSAFIIELLLNLYFHIADRADRIIRSPMMIRDIKPDLLVLENQLPFFILEDLYDPNKLNRIFHTSNRGESEIPSLIQLCLNLFVDELDVIGVDYNLETINSSEGAHFLDIIRNLCLPPEARVGRTGDAVTHVAPSITELHRAGVKLEVRSTKNLFGIRFYNGILEIPKLTISNRMQHTLRNLAAFEQCHYRNKRFADYFDLLDCFVNTPKDVELLAEYGIATYTVGDSSAACSLINSLSKGIFWSDNDFYFATLFEDLHKHCKKPWNKWKASLRQNYLNTPWAIVSVVAAGFLIILTIIQTVCSLLSLS